MKIEITQQIRDEFEKESYQKMDLLKLEIKNLKSEIKLLEEECRIWKDMYVTDKMVTNRVLVTTNDSEMHMLIDELSTIKSRISELASNVEESFRKTGKVDPVAKKEYDLLVPVLREDLEEIQKKINEKDKQDELFLRNFEELEKEFKKCKKELKQKNIKLLRLTILYKKVLNSIKSVNNAYEKGKKISEKKLELIK